MTNKAHVFSVRITAEQRSVFGGENLEEKQQELGQQIDKEIDAFISDLNIKYGQRIDGSWTVKRV